MENNLDVETLVKEIAEVAMNLDPPNQDECEKGGYLDLWEHDVNNLIVAILPLLQNFRPVTMDVEACVEEMLMGDLVDKTKKEFFTEILNRHITPTPKPTETQEEKRMPLSIKTLLDEAIRKASGELTAERKTIELLDSSPCQKFLKATLERYIFNTLLRGGYDERRLSSLPTPQDVPKPTETQKEWIAGVINEFRSDLDVHELEPEDREATLQILEGIVERRLSFLSAEQEAPKLDSFFGESAAELKLFWREDTARHKGTIEQGHYRHIMHKLWKAADALEKWKAPKLDGDVGELVQDLKMTLFVIENGSAIPEPAVLTKAATTIEALSEVRDEYLHWLKEIVHKAHTSEKNGFIQIDVDTLMDIVWPKDGTIYTPTVWLKEQLTKAEARVEEFKQAACILNKLEPLGLPYTTTEAREKNLAWQLMGLTKESPDEKVS